MKKVLDKYLITNKLHTIKIKDIVHPIIEIYVEISLIEFKQIVKGKASNYSVGWE